MYILRVHTVLTLLVFLRSEFSFVYVRYVAWGSGEVRFDAVGCRAGQETRRKGMEKEVPKL